ncbi:MAG: methyltransferase [Gammaproteobacteria bacterium]|nr:methyltransferase [Gammaproteobacteria bacterium]
MTRLPPQAANPLRAWDAADEYLLNTLAERALPQTGARLLIVNDSFGALAVALSAYRPLSLSDSWLCHAATRQNLRANGIGVEAVTLLDSLSVPQEELELVVIKAPKTLALLEDELIRLTPCLSTQTQVIVAGMVKGMPSSVWQLLERLWGPTTTALAVKKAKLIFVTPSRLAAVGESPYPVCYPLEGTTYRLCNHANLFSRDSLDIGTRFFLQHLPHHLGTREVIDLGCGNGVVGLLVAADNPQARLHFVDESFMAVASARDNFQRNLGAGREAHFHVGDALSDFAPASADLILCNPPFHQGSAVGDHIARRMFRQSRRVLRTGGELWVIGNRHLGYHQTLKTLFGNCEQIAANPKFVILRARTRT